MAEFKPVFKIDAKLIFAKLHLAALQQAEPIGPGFIINTAIANPQDKGDPNNVGNTEFDFSNKSGEYQVGYGKNDFGYFIVFDLKTDKEVVKRKTNIDKLKQSKADQLKIVEALQDLIDYVEAKYPFSKDNKDPSVKAYQDIREKALAYKAEDKKKKDSDKSLLDKSDLNKDNKDANASSTVVDQALLLLTKALESEVKFRKEQKEKDLELRKTSALEGLKTYFKTFSGKAFATKVTADSLSIKYLDTTNKIKSLNTAQKQINDFKIVGLEDKAIQDAELKHLQSKPAEPFTPTLCFVTTYTINTETM